MTKEEAIEELNTIRQVVSRQEAIANVTVIVCLLELSNKGE